MLITGLGQKTSVVIALLTTTIWKLSHALKGDSDKFSILYAIAFKIEKEWHLLQSWKDYNYNSNIAIALLHSTYVSGLWSVIEKSPI